MAVPVELVELTKAGVAAGIPVDCDMQCYAVTDVEVFYGASKQPAIFSTDFTVALNLVDYSDFSITPTASLITKITTLGEGNVIYVVRNTLPVTDFVENDGYVRAKVAFEMDRVFMAMQYTKWKVGSVFASLGNLAASVAAAAASAVSAAASAAAAALSYDNFDDRYLGPKAVAPTLDNDGNALLLGALYFNSVDFKMYQWNGAAWDLAIGTGGGGGASVTISDTAPVGPTAGDLWWTSTDGTLRVYYADGTSSQWVDATPVGPLLWGNISGTLTNQTDLQAALDDKANLNNAALTGNSTASTPAPGDNSASIATTSFVKSAIDVVLGGVGAAFDTLAEIATDLGLKALKSTTITGTGSLNGGGDLSANRTLDIVANGVTNAKLSTMAAFTFKANNTAGAAAPTDITGTNATSMLDAFTTALKGLVPASGGGTANFLRADGTFNVPPGTPLGAGLTALEAFNTNGLIVQTANDTFAGRTLTAPAAGFTITNPAGTAGNPTFVLANDLAALEALATTGIARRTAADTWTVGTLVTNAELANMNNATFKLRVTAGAGAPEDGTGTQATSLLDVFTSALKGLVPASGGGTANFMRADGTWAAPSAGSGSPGGATGEVQYNNAGAFAGAADVEIEGGQLRLPAIATPTAPAVDGLKLFGRKRGGRMMTGQIGPSGVDTSLQPHIATNAIKKWLPAGNATTIVADGAAALTATGTATAANIATTNRHTYIKRLEYLVTVAATTAVAGFREPSAQHTVGGPAAGDGGFHLVVRFGPATGVATATHRLFVGLSSSTAAPTDVEPSSITNIVGVGYDAADTNIQIMHRGAGAVTKIDLGASFPVPTADRTKVYELVLFSKPGTTQEVGYEVTDLATGAVASGTITTNLPTTTTLLAMRGWMSVGGTSSVIGIALMGGYIETDY